MIQKIMKVKCFVLLMLANDICRILYLFLALFIGSPSTPGKSGSWYSSDFIFITVFHSQGMSNFYREVHSTFSVTAKQHESSSYSEADILQGKVTVIHFSKVLPYPLLINMKISFHPS